MRHYLYALNVTNHPSTHVIILHATCTCSCQVVSMVYVISCSYCPSCATYNFQDFSNCTYNDIMYVTLKLVHVYIVDYNIEYWKGTDMMMVKHAYNTISSFSCFFTFIHKIKHLSSWKNENIKYDVMPFMEVQSYIWIIALVKTRIILWFGRSNVDTCNYFRGLSRRQWKWQ
jgi:hypothetical protein